MPRKYWYPIDNSPNPKGRVIRLRINHRNREMLEPEAKQVFAWLKDIFEPTRPPPPLDPHPVEIYGVAPPHPDQIAIWAENWAKSPNNPDNQSKT